MTPGNRIVIKRTVEISSGPTYLSVKNGQLVIRREREVIGTVPFEDIGIVIVDHPAVTYTHGVLTSLGRVGAVLVACGADHHPATLVVPIEGNTLHTERLRLQVESSRPCGKRIWQQIVRAKIRAQAATLGLDNPKYKKLMSLAVEVGSGDPTNVEAQAAKIYWQALFPDGTFRRNRDGSPPNNLLNYGYMALRAAVARAICAAGLHPSIGFHHRNRYNAFCLADDLIEPLRPLVDRAVVEAMSECDGRTELDKKAKHLLLSALTGRVMVGGEQRTLFDATARVAASLAETYPGQAKKLDLPESLELPEF